MQIKSSMISVHGFVNANYQGVRPAINQTLRFNDLLTQNIKFVIRLCYLFTFIFELAALGEIHNNVD